MPYTFNNSDGSVSTTVADSTIDTSSYALALVGRNVSNYGLYFANESFTLNVDCDDPITWFDWNSGGDETMIETQGNKLGMTNQKRMWTTGTNIDYTIGDYTAVNTPISILSITPDLAAWLSRTDFTFTGVIPEGTDETYVVTIADSTGATASAKIRFVQDQDP